MAPKRGRPAAPPKGKSGQQAQLEQLPLIKRPLELVGQTINVPGAYWHGRMSAAEKETLYVCVVRDFSALHKFMDGSTSQAFELQEMGAAGTGSLEKGDASGEIFWMIYPFPVCCCLRTLNLTCPRVPVPMLHEVFLCSRPRCQMKVAGEPRRLMDHRHRPRSCRALASVLLTCVKFLTFFYATYPEKKPTIIDATRSPAGAAATVVEIEDDEKPSSPPDIHPDFPQLRLSKAPVMEFYTINSDVLQEAGPKSGQFATEFQCLITECDGRVCGKKRTVYHKRCRSVSTTNLITHVRERAAVCTVHKAALAKIEAGSANFIDVDGETVRMYTFGESFECALPPHWAAHPARSLARRAHPSHPSPLGSLEHC